MGKRRVLGITKECEHRTVLVLKIVLGNLWFYIPVSVLAKDLVEIDPALPTVVPAKSGRHLKALMHYVSLVALEGSGFLQLVHGMRKHEDRKVPQCPLISYPLVLMYSGDIGVVTSVVLHGEM